jgi:hypothetical protein
VREATIYLVAAYRWGETNNHWYYVYAGMDRTKAFALAQAEREDRGGKYGVTVWEFTQDGIDYKNVGHFPSSAEDRDTSEPHYNHGIDYLQRLGHFLNDCAAGKALLPDPNNASATIKTLVYQDVEIPEFMREKVESEKRLLRALNDAVNERKTEGKS